MQVGSNPSLLKLFGVTSRPHQPTQLSDLAKQANQQKEAAAQPTPVAAARDPETVKEEERSLASWKKWEVWFDRMIQGTIHPLSDEAILNREEDVEVARAKGLLFEGVFAEVTFRGPGSAPFMDRQVAMMNAFHYANDLVYEAGHYAFGTNLTKFEGAALGEDAARAKRDMERNVELLAAQFGSAPVPVVEGGDGRLARQGFELRHDTFGLMLTVDDAGVFTFYDAAGTAYDAAAYAEAAPDGIIPELVNQERIKAGHLDGRF